MNPIIVIPARMGSVRLPGKPLALIAGVPMVVHVMRRALEAGIGPVAVACAEVEIAQAVLAAGGTAVLTDPMLASGSDRVHAALAELDPAGRHDVVVNVQGDTPTLDPAVLRVVSGPLADASVDIATLVCPIQSEAEAANPAFVKAACAFEGAAASCRVLYFSRGRVPAGDGPLWHHIGIYAFRRAALDRFVALPPSLLERREGLEQLRGLEAGMQVSATRVAHGLFGVDTAEELERARALLARA